jgi:hypothetical protein
MGLGTTLSPLWGQLPTRRDRMVTFRIQAHNADKKREYVVQAMKRQDAVKEAFRRAIADGISRPFITVIGGSDQ